MPKNDMDVERIIENLEGVTFSGPQELEDATAVARASSKSKALIWLKRLFKLIYHRTDVY